MHSGRYKCEALKKIRQIIADSNGIEYHTTECTYQGSCSGTCPKCEAELRYLESELKKLKSTGRKIAVAGLAIGLTMLTSNAASAQTDRTHDEIKPMECELEGDPEPTDNMYKPISDELQGEEKQVFFIVDEMPEFPGGQSAMLKFIAENIRVPELPGEIPTGKVYMRFIIDENGKVIQPEIIRGCNPVLDAEALRVISLMPDWKPGKHHGRPEKVSMMIPMKLDFK